VIIDAGAIALSKDRGPVGLNPDCGYGKVLDREGKDLNLTVSEMSQEHGVVIIKDEHTFDRLRVGSRVRVLANHSCLTAAQHSRYNVLEGEDIVDHWQIHTGW
jgi:D-serine deaminase-like pyridoxal phosphate-dependent protein